MPASMSDRENSRITKSESVFDKMLSAYSCLALACAGALFVPAAQAEVSYKKIDRMLVPNIVGYLDLDSDGTADFKYSDVTFRQGHSSTSVFNFVFLAGQQQYNGIAGERCASRLRAGVSVGSQLTFSNTGSFVPNCPQWQASRGYLGVKFEIAGQPHYGWIRLIAGFANGFWQGRMTAYAYESAPDTPIVVDERAQPDSNISFPPAAGQGSLGDLARGRTNHQPT